MADRRSKVKNEDTAIKFTINQKFAESFENRKRREEIIKAKEKAKFLRLDSGSEIDDSDEESEDSAAELLTKKAEAKFMKALVMIQKGDPKLKDPNYKIFVDSDFETSSEKSKESDKPIRYKDLVRKEAKKGSLLDEDKIRPETKIEEAQRIKAEFQAAANTWKLNEGEEILKPRVKTEKEVKDEESRFQEFLENYVDSEEKKSVDELKQFWLSKKNADEDFLKKFVINRMWKDEGEILKTYDEIVEHEDEKNFDEAEKFEHVYNYRFEEEGADKIISNS